MLKEDDMLVRLLEVSFKQRTVLLEAGKNEILLPRMDKINTGNVCLEDGHLITRNNFKDPKNVFYRGKLCAYAFLGSKKCDILFNIYNDDEHGNNDHVICKSYEISKLLNLSAKNIYLSLHIEENGLLYSSYSTSNLL